MCTGKFTGSTETPGCTSRLLKIAHLRRYASVLAAHVRQKYAPLLVPRMPCIWTFLSSLKEAFFSKLLNNKISEYYG